MMTMSFIRPTISDKSLIKDSCDGEKETKCDFLFTYNNDFISTHNLLIMIIHGHGNCYQLIDKQSLFTDYHGCVWRVIFEFRSVPDIT